MDLMEKAQMHFDVLEGRSDYIPLAISIPPRERVGITPWEAMHNPQAHINAFLKNNEFNLQFQSDRIVAIESNFLENLIPSMFGAETYASPG
ncbi:MAG: hypothetical protein IKB34_07765, partial [Clostridia bacterium]|nr:hypothetical protein [Clostridia bacterium]